MSEQFNNLIRQDRPEDPKRYAVVRSSQSLFSGFLLMCAASAYEVIKYKDIGDNTLKAVLGLAFILAALAGVTHAKTDTEPNPEPPKG